MGNCLITKLKASIADDTLPVVGGYTVKFAKTGKLSGKLFQMALKSGYTRYTAQLKITGDAYFTDSEGVENYGKTREASNEMLYFMVNELPASVTVVDDYHGVTTISTDTSVLKYRKSIITAGLSKDFICPKFNSADLSECTHIHELYLNAYDESYFERLHLNDFHLYDSNNFTLYFPNLAFVTGDMDDFLDACYAGGKTSGNITFSKLNSTSITYGGESMPNSSIAFTFSDEGWSKIIT